MKDETQKEIVERRNSWLLNFFEVNEITPIRLVGDPNKPAIIYQEKFVLSAYVHNFYLNFTDKPYGGDVIKTFKLTPKPPLAKKEVLGVIEDYPQKEIYRIRLAQMKDLYLTGYNFKNRHKADQQEKYPVFARHDPKIYFSEERVEEIKQMLIDLGYDVEIE